MDMRFLIFAVNLATTQLLLRHLERPFATRCFEFERECNIVFLKLKPNLFLFLINNVRHSYTPKVILLLLIHTKHEIDIFKIDFFIFQIFIMNLYE